MDKKAKCSNLNKQAKVYCRGCGSEMGPGGARRIGICVSCIAESTHALTIPSAGYGGSK